ncbi:MAG TPA: ATPase domain-containing protein, partial [Candidatus Gracilibacteria bacterium]|nr:ATPase domain-containing protein [Candidatus Gracilibacteria bacterium]
MKNTNKTSFFCTNCGNEFPRWSGQCPSCQEWNTISEAKFREGKSFKSTNKLEFHGLKEDSKENNIQRFSTQIQELDRVLGGGIVSDSLILLTGDPGIGKSTLSLQIAINLAKEKGLRYFSGEESENQIISRAKRLGLKTNSQLEIASTNS